jgi:uncharacterized membrane protein
MHDFALVMLVAGIVVLFLIVEVVAAVLPILVVIVLVPPEERDGLAQLIAAADSSRKLRLWPALRAAVASRRRARSVQEERQTVQR